MEDDLTVLGASIELNLESCEICSKGLLEWALRKFVYMNFCLIIEYSGGCMRLLIVSKECVFL